MKLVRLFMREFSLLNVEDYMLIVSRNATEIVQTYPTYLINASKMFLAKGAGVILSSPTPSNPWETGNYTYSPDRFTYYAS